MPPTLANGKVCYIEIPATDVHRSSDFYEEVFGWRIRQRSDGHTAFDDTTGEVSGTWVRGRPPASEPGLLLYIMVDSVAATADAVIAAAIALGASACGSSTQAGHQTAAQDGQRSHARQRQTGRLGTQESLGGVPVPFAHQEFDLTNMWLGHRGPFSVTSTRATRRSHHVRASSA